MSASENTDNRGTLTAFHSDVADKEARNNDKRRCVDIDCERNDEFPSLFTFPLVNVSDSGEILNKTEYYRCKIWIKNCGIESLRILNPASLHNRFHLCVNHFSDSEFESVAHKNRLKKTAIPTIFSRKPFSISALTSFISAPLEIGEEKSDREKSGNSFDEEKGNSFDEEKPRKETRRCIYNDCLQDDKSLSLFTFPRIVTSSTGEVIDKEGYQRCQLWIANSKINILRDLNPSKLYNRFFLCSKHFNDDQFTNAKLKNRLKRGAVPTIFPFGASSYIWSSSEKKIKDRRRCIDGDCERDEESPSLFTFPRINCSKSGDVLDEKEYDRCQLWVKNCGIEALANVHPSNLYDRYYVCGNHFDDSQFTNVKLKNRLKRTAVPTIFSRKSLKDPSPNNFVLLNDPLQIDTETSNTCITIICDEEIVNKPEDADKFKEFVMKQEVETSDDIDEDHLAAIDGESDVESGSGDNAGSSKPEAALSSNFISVNSGNENRIQENMVEVEDAASGIKEGTESLTPDSASGSGLVNKPGLSPPKFDLHSIVNSTVRVYGKKRLPAINNDIAEIPIKQQKINTQFILPHKVVILSGKPNFIDVPQEQLGLSNRSTRVVIRQIRSPIDNLSQAPTTQEKTRIDALETSDKYQIDPFENELGTGSSILAYTKPESSVEEDTLRLEDAMSSLEDEEEDRERVRCAMPTLEDLIGRLELPLVSLEGHTGRPGHPKSSLKGNTGRREKPRVIPVTPKITCKDEKEMEIKEEEMICDAIGAPNGPELDEKFGSKKRYCVICKSKYGPFFMFPKEADLCEQWKKLCGITTLTKRTEICSLHFRKEDFRGGKVRCRLAKGTLPSVNLFCSPRGAHTMHAKNPCCIVPGCLKKKEDGVTLHYWPRLLERRQLWASLCNLRKVPKRDTLICSGHFVRADFRLTDNSKKLKQLANPSLNLPNDTESPKDSLNGVVDPKDSLNGLDPKVQQMYQSQWIRGTDPKHGLL